MQRLVEEKDGAEVAHQGGRLQRYTLELSGGFMATLMTVILSVTSAAIIFRRDEYSNHL